MPTIKIELLQGLSSQSLLTLRDAVSEAIIGALQLPSDDSNLRILEYKPEYFKLKAPYEILIEIALFSGRSKETKKLLFQTIVANIEQRLSIDRTKIFILLNEQPMVNWGVRGGLPANEIPLDFKVEE